MMDPESIDLDIMKIEKYRGGIIMGQLDGKIAIVLAFFGFAKQAVKNDNDIMRYDTTINGLA